eukprot:17123-Pleurochrysis_carterae.AAC.1
MGKGQGVDVVGLWATRRVKIILRRGGSSDLCIIATREANERAFPPERPHGQQHARNSARARTEQAGRASPRRLRTSDRDSGCATRALSANR